jgi:type IX secretion system PorP/SprF family membrane protein
VRGRTEDCIAWRCNYYTLSSKNSNAETDNVKKTLLFLLLLSCAGNVRAQDIHFSQFFENSALRNPALTGIFSGDYRVSANYRSQWGSFVTPFQTALVSAETKALIQAQTRDYLSFGLTTVYDKAGSLDFTSLSAYGAVNYNKALGAESQTYLSVGLCGGYIQRSFDANKMKFASQYTGGAYSTANPSGETVNYAALRHWDASAGVSLSGAINRKLNYYLGGAGYHVSKPQESYYGASFIRLTTRWSGNAGISARLGHGFGLTVHANYQHQDPYQELIAGGLLSRSFKALQSGRKMILGVGCFYRYQDAVIPTMQMAYDNWTVTMSYDITMASRRLYLSGFGGYEFTVALRGNYKREKPAGLMCPQFELQDLDGDEYVD